MPTLVEQQEETALPVYLTGLQPLSADVKTMLSRVPEAGAVTVVSLRDITSSGHV